MIQRHIRGLVFRLALRAGRHDIAYYASPSRYFQTVVGPLIGRAFEDGMAGR